MCAHYAQPPRLVNCRFLSTSCRPSLLEARALAVGQDGGSSGSDRLAGGQQKPTDISIVASAGVMMRR
jgi:hypothetical protein